MSEKDFYLETIGQIVPANHKQIVSSFYEFLDLQHTYDSAVSIVETQLNIYDSEFSLKLQRNPIHSIESRIKSPQSIVGKLQKKGLPVTAQAAMQNLMDIAGVRVVCYYIDDIYAVAELLTQNTDFQAVKIKDYIKNPKPSGYRSLHLVVMVPVSMATCKRNVPVEIQIRTIAMDFWASLEHQLRYKTKTTVTPDLVEELKDCARSIADTDMRMQEIYRQLSGEPLGEPPETLRTCE